VLTAKDALPCLCSEAVAAEDTLKAIPTNHRRKLLCRYRKICDYSNKCPASFMGFSKQEDILKERHPIFIFPVHERSSAASAWQKQGDQSETSINAAISLCNHGI
jgi:hypothetical protein